MKRKQARREIDGNTEDDRERRGGIRWSQGEPLEDEESEELKDSAKLVRRKLAC